MLDRRGLGTEAVRVREAVGPGVPVDEWLAGQDTVSTYQVFPEYGQTAVGPRKVEVHDGYALLNGTKVSFAGLLGATASSDVWVGVNKHGALVVFTSAH